MVSNLHLQKIALKVRRDGPQPSIFVRSFSAITIDAIALSPVFSFDDSTQLPFIHQHPVNEHASLDETVSYRGSSLAWTRFLLFRCAGRLTTSDTRTRYWRRVAKNVMISRASSSGSSIAAKCAPRGIGVHWQTL